MKSAEDYYLHGRPEVAAFIPKDTRTLLDVGCGEGLFLKLVKTETTAETWGIEVVQEIADRARRNADKILQGRIEDVLDSVPDNYFDCISFNDVLEHLIEPIELLKMVKPKLSQNGIIIASIPNVRYFYNLYELLIKKDWKYMDAGILDSTHFRFFTKKSMKRMFEESGYVVVKQQGINQIPSRKFKLFNLLTFFLLDDTRYLQFLSIARPKL